MNKLKKIALLLGFGYAALLLLDLAYIKVFGQTPAQSLTVVLYSNITSASRLDGCDPTYPCIDNRSQFTRQSSTSSYRAYGIGSWSVDLQWADGSSSGPWTSFGSTGQVNQAGPSSGIGYGIGPGSIQKSYHDYIRLVITGNVTIMNYTGTRQFWWLPSVAAIAFPLTANQGGTYGAFYVDQLASTLPLACSNATAQGLSLMLTVSWSVPTGFTCAANIFAMFGGVIVPASAQTVTLSQCPQAAGLFKIVDTHLGGHVAIPASCSAPIQWWGAVGDDSTDNANALNEMGTYVSQIFIPPGTYRSSQTWTVGILGQKITGASMSTSILKFTGATQGIDMFNNSVSLTGNTISDLMITTTNASGNSALIIDSDSNPSSHITVDHIDFETTGGSAGWINGLRVLGNQGMVASNMKCHGNITQCVLLGDGTVVTDVRLMNNVYGSAGSSGGAGTYLVLNNAQNIVSQGDYFQAGITNYITTDVSSIFDFNDGEFDSSGGAVTHGIVSNGVTRIRSLTISGSGYGDAIVAQNGWLTADNVYATAAASVAIVRLRTASPGSSVTNSNINNAHATGNAIEVDFGTNSVVSHNQRISAVGGACIALASNGSNLDLGHNDCTSSTGYGVNILSSGAPFTFTDTGTNYNVTDLAHICGNCDGGVDSIPLNIGSNARTFNHTTLIPDAVGQGAAVASQATITPTGPFFHITGTSAISNITVPFAGYSGCVQVVPDAVWTLSTGGNTGTQISKNSTAVVGQLMNICYDGIFGKRTWYPSY